MRRPTARWILAIAIILSGASIVFYGLTLANANPRTNEQDDVAWLIFAIGAMILGAGIYLPIGEKANWIGVLVASFIAPIALFALIVMLYWLAVIAMGILAVIAH